MKLRYIHKGNGRLYILGKALMTWHGNLHFRQINLSHLHNIQHNTPVIIAANHPTAFVDPVVLGTYAAPPMYFMTRGDIFKNKRIRQILESFNMFPVNRRRDGFSDPNRLEEMNEIVHERLVSRTAICVFVEGQHHADKRVLPVQKGIARMAFSTFEKWEQKDLQILPVGCNYWFTDKTRDVLHLNAGAPIFVKDYWDEYKVAPAAAMLRLCKDIRDHLLLHCYHIESPEDDELGEQLLILDRSEHPIGHFPVRFNGRAAFDREKAILDALNKMDKGKKTILKAATNAYFSELASAGLKDESLLNHQWLGFGRWVLLVLGFPLFLLGFVVHAPIAALARWVTSSRIKKREFKSSIYLGIEMFVGAFWYFLLALISFFTLKPALIAVAFMLPLTAWFALVYREVAQRMYSVIMTRLHPKGARLRAVRRKLESLRNESFNAAKPA